MDKVQQVINLSLQLAYERDKTEEDLNVERIMKSLNFKETIIIRVHFGLEDKWASDDEGLAKQLKMEVESLVKTRDEILVKFEKIGSTGQ